jgi:MFS family permease
MNSKRLAGDRRAVIAGVVGNMMEWYDFSVYGYFATNIGRHFFPTQDAVSPLIAAFGVFAAGFLMRPLGSLVFGHIGDKMGRKMALTASVVLMAIPTFLIGALPYLSADWGDGLGIAGFDAAASRTFGRWRIYDLLDISCRTFSCRPSGVFRKFC